MGGDAGFELDDNARDRDLGRLVFEYAQVGLKRGSASLRLADLFLANDFEVVIHSDFVEKRRTSDNAKWRDKNAFRDALSDGNKRALYGHGRGLLRANV